MPTLPLTPPANATTTTFQIGTYNSVTDTFTVVYDLNDYTHTWLHNAKTQLQPGKKVAVRSSNMRVNGERVVRWRRPNAHVTVECYIRDTTPQAVVSRVHSLIAAVENPPYVIRFAEPGATSYSYFDVVLCDPSPPYDPQTLNANAITHVALDFEVRPEYRGDRITLQNLAVNPGFEAPSGPGVFVFSDSFANVNAYTAGGGTPTVASNVMTIPNGATVTFGSPAWSAINDWQQRFQFATGMSATFFLHRKDASNDLHAFVGAGTFSLAQTVGGTVHTIASASPTFTNGNWYWLEVTQHPSVNGSAPYIAASLFNDSAGAPGSLITTITGNTFDAVTALNGSAGWFVSGANLLVGGNFPNVHILSVFGPGGWTLSNFGTGAAYGAWESAWGSPTYAPAAGNLYTGGPVTSFGAARIDAPPAGTLNAFWYNYTGGAPAGTWAVPVAAAGNTLDVAVWAKSSGLGANATVVLGIGEFDASGVSLRQNTVQSAAASVTNAGWTQLSGSYTTGANCAYAQIQLGVIDTSAPGASAGATVWFDNVQCWNQTTTGQTTMPYCELRFPQSPAQLVVSGIQGDAPARALVSAATYLASWSTSQSGTLWLGRRAKVTAGAQLIAASLNLPPALDSTAWGGFTSPANPGPISMTEYDAQGVYHLYARAETGVGSPTTIQVQTDLLTSLIAAGQTPAASYQSAQNNHTSQAEYQGPYVNPFTAQNTWTVFDIGQAILPPAPQSNLTDLTKLAVTSGAQSAPGNTMITSNWVALLPVDGEVAIVSFSNPSSGHSITQKYLWLYIDGTVGMNGAASSGVTAFSQETTALPNLNDAATNPTHSANTYALTVTPAADLYLRLDPSEPMLLNGTAVNQLLAIFTDNNATVLPALVEIVYSPVYLFPR